ncbi:protein SUPPRESSOR OF PHYA-105 1 [Striga asiatica]|uniref:Protein SUPPRESSOR OF PHYA-105 1 n=1 Tax=Striga asiatica TaxID=4170 RepID=A0A5A7PP20_STRAF|nr:protein SUPPRESSOR OF PHYA-105 1 [Striga asiatica]
MGIGIRGVALRFLVDKDHGCPTGIPDSLAFGNPRYTPAGLAQNNPPPNLCGVRQRRRCAERSVAVACIRPRINERERNHGRPYPAVGRAGTHGQHPRGPVLNAEERRAVVSRRGAHEYSPLDRAERADRHAVGEEVEREDSEGEGEYVHAVVDGGVHGGENVALRAARRVARLVDGHVGERRGSRRGPVGVSEHIGAAHEVPGGSGRRVGPVAVLVLRRAVADVEPPGADELVVAGKGGVELAEPPPPGGWRGQALVVEGRVVGGYAGVEDADNHAPSVVGVRPETRVLGEAQESGGVGRVERERLLRVGRDETGLGLKCFRLIGG